MHEEPENGLFGGQRRRGKLRMRPEDGRNLSDENSDKPQLTFIHSSIDLSG